MTRFPDFLRLNNIPLHICMYLTLRLSIHLDTWVASPFFVNNAAVNRVPPAVLVSRKVCLPDSLSAGFWEFSQWKALAGAWRRGGGERPRQSCSLSASGGVSTSSSLSTEICAPMQLRPSLHGHRSSWWRWECPSYSCQHLGCLSVPCLPSHPGATVV